MVIELTADEMLKLKALAEVTQRPETELAREAMHWFLSVRHDDTAAIAQSREDIAAGRTIEHRDLFAQIERELSS
jgi:predicted transcriptional regulator